MHNVISIARIPNMHGFHILKIRLRRNKLDYRFYGLNKWLMIAWGSYLINALWHYDVNMMIIYLISKTLRLENLFFVSVMVRIIYLFWFSYILDLLIQSYLINCISFNFMILNFHSFNLIIFNLYNLQLHYLQFYYLQFKNHSVPFSYELLLNRLINNRHVYCGWLLSITRKPHWQSLKCSQLILWAIIVSLRAIFTMKTCCYRIKMVFFCTSSRKNGSCYRMRAERNRLVKMCAHIVAVGVVVAVVAIISAE